MASTSEIRRRIASVRETQKITHAMYLISQAKLRRAREELEHTRPYFNALRTEIKRIFRVDESVDESVDSRYFSPEDAADLDQGTYGLLVITADKGLAGAYNQNVIRRAQAMMEQHPDVKLYVVGEYGRRWFQQKHIPIKSSFLYTAQNPTLHRAREIGSVLLEGYDTGLLSKLIVIYTDLKNGLEESVREVRLLPLHRHQFGTPDAERAVLRPFEFSPTVSQVLDHVVGSYVSGFIYSALVDSFCSEQSARMAAMDSANRNAQQLLDQLSLEYNRARQTAITQEITEVSAGARARARQKKKRTEKEGEIT